MITVHTPRPFVGFEHFVPVWQERWQRFMVKVKPGEFYVAPPSMAITTVLGSCISACIRDPELGIGGINHFMLPEEGEKKERLSSASYGAFAMEQLINSLLKLGCRRDTLEIKLAGGANMFNSGYRVGDLNVQFIHDYLSQEGFRIFAEDVGGEQARRLIYLPDQGRMLIKRMDKVAGVISEEKAYRAQTREQSAHQDVELF